MTDKKTRLEAVKQLLSEEGVPDQGTLVERLKERFTIETTQTAVSRDLRHLGVVKKQVRGRLQYELPATTPTEIILKEAVLGVEHNESMIVIHTFPALADFLGDFIDSCQDLPILGCVSGENTVFVAPRSVGAIESVKDRLCKKLGYFPNSGEE